VLCIMHRWRRKKGGGYGAMKVLMELKGDMWRAEERSEQGWQWGNAWDSRRRTVAVDGSWRKDGNDEKERMPWQWSS
jgi:hypothetical protein